MTPFKFISVLVLPCLWLSTAFAAEPNPEDLPIEDAPPTASVPASGSPATGAPVAGNQRPPATAASATAISSSVTVADGDAPVVITKSQWEQFLARQKQLEDELAALKGKISSAPGLSAAEDEVLTADVNLSGSTTRPALGNRSLLLPDISFIGTGRFDLSTDRRDADRGRFALTEGELSIQSYVYPNVKADAFIVASPSGGEAFNIEEGYLTFVGLRKNLSLVAGRKKVAFGRTNELHPHSFLYARQLLPIQNLIAEESLTGDGLMARYLLPTGKNLFANLDVGIWSNANDPGVASTASTSDEIARGTGPGFNGRFYTARLWTSKAIGKSNEVELGASLARGSAQLEDDTGAVRGRGHATLTGVDFSWRRFFSGPKRLLLRGEYFGYRPEGGLQDAARRTGGWYALANYRISKRDDVGLLYERSGFPQRAGQESASSVIFTRQFTEQFYIRVQGTHGDRPGSGGYNAATVMMVWGVGPHTHSLE
jgi:hypothetical protein